MSESRSEAFLCSAASFTFSAGEVQTQDKSFSKESNKNTQVNKQIATTTHTTQVIFYMAASIDGLKNTKCEFYVYISF